VIGRLIDSALGLQRRPTVTRPIPHHVDPAETLEAAEQFIAARTRASPLVARAYEQLEDQTNRMYAVLTSEGGPYRLTVVPTSQTTPYNDADELIESVLATRTLEMTTSHMDRMHPSLGGAAGSSYFRFRAVHDLVGHVATGFGFDPDGEYSAWVVQRAQYTGLARWAAATELHGEISVLWTTGQFAEHKAILLDHRRVTLNSAIEPTGRGLRRCWSCRPPRGWLAAYGRPASAAAGSRGRSLGGVEALASSGIVDHYTDIFSRPGCADRFSPGRRREMRSVSARYDGRRTC
jgi:hypothetical protein